MLFAPKPSTQTPGEAADAGSLPAHITQLCAGPAGTWQGRFSLPIPKCPFQGQAWDARLPRVEKNRPFPLVSLPDEYYSTTYNIYKSSSWQLPKDVRKTPLQTGKGCETRSLRDSVVFAEDCPSGFMVHIFSSETLETSKLRRL